MYLARTRSGRECHPLDPGNFEGKDYWEGAGDGNGGEREILGVIGARVVGRHLSKVATGVFALVPKKEGEARNKKWPYEIKKMCLDSPSPT